VIACRDILAGWWRTEEISSGLQHHFDDHFRSWATHTTINLNLSRGSRAGLSGFGLDTETVDPVCIHGRLPDTVG